MQTLPPAATVRPLLSEQTTPLHNESLHALPRTAQCD